MGFGFVIGLFRGRVRGIPHRRVLPKGKREEGGLSHLSIDKGNKKRDGVEPFRFLLGQSILDDVEEVAAVLALVVGYDDAIDRLAFGAFGNHRVFRTAFRAFMAAVTAAASAAADGLELLVGKGDAFLLREFQDLGLALAGFDFGDLLFG